MYRYGTRIELIKYINHNNKLTGERKMSQSKNFDEKSDKKKKEEENK